MEILATESHQTSETELPPNIESEILKALSPDIRLDIIFDPNSIYLILENQKQIYPDLENSALVNVALKDIDKKMVENKLRLTQLEDIDEKVKRSIKNFEEAKAKLSKLQLKYSMLRQQLESQLDNGLDLEGTPIQDALDQYRRFRSKLKSLPEDSLEREDIERVLAIYAEYIKQEFEQSPEKYSIGTSQPLRIDIGEIVYEFIEPNDLTNEQKSHQRNIAEARKNITQELSQTPGVLGVIPMAGEVEGSKNFDIIAITLNPDNNNLSPEEINIALKLLYSQIQNSANSKQGLIEANILDPSNIEIYSDGKPLADFTEDNKPESELDPSQIFQLHTIKVAKRSTDFKYKKEYTAHAMAMVRPSQSLEDNNNIPTLTNSYTTQGENGLTYTPFNQAMFQLSAQQALGLDLA